LSADAGARAPVRLLVVLPSPPLRLLAVAAFREALARGGRELVAIEAGSAFEALWLAPREAPTGAVVALDLPVLSGEELVGLLRSRPAHRQLPVVVVAPHSDESAPARADRTGAAALLRTPFDGNAVASALASAGVGA
jgi:CheY-like chemotaxis protein